MDRPSGYVVSTDRSRLDLDLIHSFLTEAYWSPGVPADVVARSIAKVACVVEHPDLHGMRRWALATEDAHGLYRRFGFGPPAKPEIHLFIERGVDELWGAETHG